jgi:hypothetical protein
MRFHVVVICSHGFRTWKPYTLSEGMLSTFSRHLKRHHHTEYMQYCEESNKRPLRSRDEPFEMEVFHEKLARFIATTDTVRSACL